MDSISGVLKWLWFIIEFGLICEILLDVKYFKNIEKLMQSHNLTKREKAVFYNVYIDTIYKKTMLMVGFSLFVGVVLCIVK